MTARQYRAVTRVATFVALLSGGAVNAQSLTVLPVTIQMTQGRMATALTVINHGDSETGVQVRAFAWNQEGGRDQLVSSEEVLASPPLATIPPRATQIVRLVLRRPPQEHEATYRILLDQIPAPAAPGTVRIALRLSIPVFAEPTVRVAPHVQFRIERDAGQAWLVAFNGGGRHETIRDIALTTNDGSGLQTETNVSPYLLAGATRRWRIVSQARLPAQGGTVRLTALASTGIVDQPVPVVAGP
ncbi:fimbria/pilus periplasmic chaperone [Burkholderia ambifaria]|uniref:fimbrial biogenesis chaperone n=1 Tax=Burkholderia ambifaria TaxID=152480 RepID=UPI001E3C1CD2|nr:fimbria/pilus periplasmic chaperone [Burkholderia ambifaria]UEP26127.1 fimbria/pilus periplasmic chaperone [Burkholderia ambifaria]